MAAYPPPDVVDTLATLPRPDERGVRYTPRHQWHVTLRFLGDCDEAAATTAIRNLDTDTALARLGPRVATLGRSVVVVPVAGLEDLAADIADVTAGIGDADEGRAFRGHLTIARLRRPGSASIVGHPIGVTFPVASVALVRSTLGQGPARHEPILHQSLGTAGPDP